jgi:hypothetical protein
MTTSRILACYQTRKTPDFAPTQQFAMHTFTAAAKWDGHKWWPAVDIFEERPGYRVKKRTIKGNNSFESQDEALKEAYGLADQAQEKPGPFLTKTKH